MSAPSLPELLPCPFCGGKDGDLVQAYVRATDDFAYWSVECLKCGVEVADDHSQAAADAAWNTRTPAEPVSAVSGAEAMREAAAWVADDLARDEEGTSHADAAMVIAHRIRALPLPADTITAASWRADTGVEPPTITESADTALGWQPIAWGGVDLATSRNPFRKAQA